MAKSKYLFVPIKVAVRQMVCDHEYMKERLPCYSVKDGWLIPVYQDRCIKCGKVKRRRDD